MNPEEHPEEPATPQPDSFNSFNSFYGYYLTQHRNRANQYLHFVGAILSIVVFFFALITLRPMLVIVALLINPLLAWPGHFLVEGNRPVSFRYPLYSFLASYVMSYHLSMVLLGRRRSIEQVHKEDPLITE